MTKQECSLYEYQSRPSDQYPDISNYLYMVYEWRSDTHELFNLNKQEGVQSYIVWWLRWGHKNFKAPALYSLDSEYLNNLFEDSAITITILGHQFKLPNIAYWTHQNSDGLQEKFPLESKANEYILWFITEGIQEYSLRYESQFSCPLIDFLKQPALNSLGQQSPISNALLLTHHCNQDLSSIYDLDSQQGNYELLRWWYNYGQDSHSFSPSLELDESLARLGFNDSQKDVTVLGQCFKLPNIFDWIHYCRQDLQEQFPLESKANEYIFWLITEGIAEYSLHYEPEVFCPLIDFLKQPAVNKNGQQSIINNALALTHSCFSDLNNAYDLQSRQGSYELLSWWRSYGKDSHSFTPSLELDESLALIGFNDSETEVSVLGQRYKLPNIFDWVHYNRQDLQEQYPLENKADEYILWVLTTGMPEYAIEYNDQYQSALIEYIKSDNKDRNKTGNNAIRLIHKSSPGIAEIYPAESLKAWQSYLLWLWKFGSALYPFSPSLHLLDSFNQYCFEDSDTDIRVLGRPFKLPKIAYWLHNNDEGLQQEFPLETNANKYILWFITVGIKENWLRYEKRFSCPLIEFLKQPAFNTHKQLSPINNALALIHHCFADLSSAYNIESRQGSYDYLRWWFDYGKENHSFSPSLGLDESLTRIGFNDSQTKVNVLGQSYNLPNVFDWIHYCRQDLQEQFPLESKANEYVLWALTTGMSEYGIQYDDQYQSVLIEYIKYDNKDQHKTGDNVIRLIHQASPGIAEFYPIESIDAWQSYLLWLYELGSDLYPFSPSLHLMDNFERYCFENSNTDIIIFDRPFKLPNVADWFYNQPEVRETFNLTGNAADYLAWFIFYRPSSKETIPKYTNDNELYSFLKQTCDGHELISNYLALIYSYRKDVAEVHSITGYKSELDFINWWLKWDKSEGTNAEEVVSIHALEKVYSELRDYIGSNFIALEESTTEDNNTSIAVIDGINIIGMPKSPIGIGEDCRLITAAIEQLDTPFNVIDIEQKKIDSTETNYKVNIFTLPAPNIAANAAKFDGAFFKDKINIASTPWELSKWPKSLYWMFDFFDEFWVHSDFVWYSIPEKYHHKLRKIHLPVEVAPTALSTRSDFEIPEDKFVFFSSFDFSSYSERKNPYAAIKAFNIAFPCGEGHDEQHLLIKTHNGHLHQEKLQQLNEYIENNSRISTVDASLSKAGLHDLYRCCDCHVSLHRSEGFGRNIAESMLLNLPNIVTSYSGNLDFCRPDNSYLVDHALIALSPNDYIFGTGQQWAEPSVEHAAQLMIKVIKDKDSPEQTRLLNNANELITNEYSIEQLTHTIEKLKLLKDSSHEPYNEI